MAESLANLATNDDFDLDDYAPGQWVDISSYTYQNRYTVPHFGFIAVRVAANNTAYLSGSSVDLDIHVSAPSSGKQSATIPVLKGERFYCGGNPEYVKYLPFVKA